MITCAKAIEKFPNVTQSKALPAHAELLQFSVYCHFLKCHTERTLAGVSKFKHATHQAEAGWSINDAPDQQPGQRYSSDPVIFRTYLLN